MELTDTILILDRWQGRPDAARCGIDPEHGKLTAHGTGKALICGGDKGKCNYGVAIDSGMIGEALEYSKYRY